MSAWISSFLSRHDTSPTKPRSIQPFYDSRDQNDWLFDTVDSSPTSDLDRQLLPDMPSLFTPDLPPCGLEVQIAYQNVVHRLRCLWLQHGADKTPHYIAKLVKNALAFEALSSPVGTLALTGTRRPWRRETVFNFEIRWAGYFVREAGVLKRWPRMTEAERDRQEFSQSMFRVPRELGVMVKCRENQASVFELWEKWHALKRRDLVREKKGVQGDAEVVEEEEEEEHGEVEVEEEQKLDGEVQELGAAETAELVTLNDLLARQQCGGVDEEGEEG